MTSKMRVCLYAAATGVLLSASVARADVVASATTDLNIRSGPGPQYDVVGVIKGKDKATVKGCIEGSLWCDVSYKGKKGWAYSKYLSMPMKEKTVVLSEQPNAVPVVKYSGPGPAAGATGGATAGAVAGALIGGPAGAVVGGTAGAAAGAALTPPAPVGTYVTEHPVDPVYLDGEVVVGAGLPSSVKVYPVPDSEYEYAYVNRVPVLVRRGERRIIYVYR